MSITSALPIRLLASCVQFVTAVALAAMSAIGLMAAEPYRGIVVSAGPFDAGLSDPAMAINHPDAYAWQLFSALNRPLGSGSPHGVWQSWIEELNLFADPTEAPEWDEATNLEFVAGPAFGHVSRSNTVEQVKNNPELFAYIRDQKLWYQEGLPAAAEQGSISFPIGAKVVKGTWPPLRPDEDPSRFVTVIETDTWEIINFGTGLKRTTLEKPRTLALIAWSIATKDLPTWFWATFEHVDSPGRRDVTGALDNFGTDPAFSPPGKRHGMYPPESLTPRYSKCSSATDWLRPTATTVFEEPRFRLSMRWDVRRSSATRCKKSGRLRHPRA